MAQYHLTTVLRDISKKVKDPKFKTLMMFEVGPIIEFLKEPEGETQDVRARPHLRNLLEDKDLESDALDAHRSVTDIPKSIISHKIDRIVGRNDFKEPLKKYLIGKKNKLFVVRKIVELFNRCWNTIFGEPNPRHVQYSYVDFTPFLLSQRIE